MPNTAPDIANADTLVIAAGADAISFGIAAPTDADGDPLTITLTAVPDYGVVEYWNGAAWTTVSGAGQTLTADELASLRYTPPASGEHADETLAYTVSDGHTTVTGSTEVAVHVDAGGPGSLVFSAIGAGMVGADLYTVDAAGDVTAEPVRTGPNATFGSDAGENGGFVQFGGDLYFNGDTDAAGSALMKLTAGGVASVVSDGSGGVFGDTFESSNFIQFAGGLYFRALTQEGDELVRLNTDGTSHVFDVNTGPGFNSAPGQTGGFIDFDHELYFSAIGPGDSGPDLFRLDGAGNLSAIPVRTGPNAQFGSFAGEDGGYVVFDNALYFNAFTETTSDTLFKLAAGSSTAVAVDPTGASMSHLNGADSGFHVFDGSLYFNALSQTLSDSTLFELDSAGTLTAKTYQGHALENAGALGGFTDMAGATYFTASTAATGLDLFKLSASGAVSAIDVNPGAFDAFDDNLGAKMVVFDGSLYFDADTAGGDGLFKLDAHGTLTQIDLNGGGTTQAGVEGGFQIYGDKLWFSAYTADGYELVRLASDGSSTSFDLNAGPGANSTPGENGGFGVFPASDFIGTAGDDILAAGALGQTLSGGAGDDLLRGGAGNDSLDGGTGTDTASYADAQADVTVSLAISGAQATGGGGTDTLSSIENLTGSAFDDHLTGDHGANVLDGGAGADLLAGGAGDDTLTGGTGSDLLAGGPGDDVLDGGDGTDRATFISATVGVSIDLSASGAQDTGAGHDTLISIENLTGSTHDDSLTGDGGANTLAGDDGDDQLDGGGGADSLIGGAGDDTLTGGTGDDTLAAGAGNDTASFAGAASGETIDLRSGSATGGDGTDLLRGVENIIGSNAADQITGNGLGNHLAGNDGTDLILGGNGDDSIDGGAGADTLNGGHGADTLTGGGGQDSFVFDSISDLRSGADLITDLNNSDVIDLSGMDPDPLPGDQAFRIVSAFDGHRGEIVIGYDAGADQTSIQFDLNRDGVADASILISGDHRDFANFVL